jgi:hypothetical protein
VEALKGQAAAADLGQQFGHLLGVHAKLLGPPPIFIPELLSSKSG